MFRGLICQWVNITRSKTVRRYIEHGWQITDYILFIIFSTWFLPTVILPISSFSNLNFCHIFLPVFWPSIKSTSPQPTLFDVPYQQQTMGQWAWYTRIHWFLYFWYCYEWLCFKFPSQQKFLYCKCKISTLLRPFHIIDEDRNTHSTISFYMVLKQKSLTDKKWVGQKFYKLILLNRSCFPHFVVHSFPNAIMHGHSWVTAMSVAKKTRILCKKGK